MAHRPPKTSLYLSEPDSFSPGFNRLIVSWLRNESLVREHQPAKAFEPVRKAYDVLLQALVASGNTPVDAHRAALTSLTPLLLGVDISKFLSGRLDPSLINVSGFRTALAQGSAKNNGENFVNVMVYALGMLLSNQDEVLIDKGAPPKLREALTLVRSVKLANRTDELKLPIECDFSIFSRTNPLKAIVINAKTRLKEVFHVATMWKLLFDSIGDSHCAAKWGLKSSANPADVTYCFATADMIPKEGKKTQGPDVERAYPRNLIAMDASFFHYVFVSKPDISHVAKTLAFGANKKEALFHELGCLIDLIMQKFSIKLP